MRTLIVEDDAKLARFLSRVLTEEGFVADTCASGVDALTQAKSGLYDLVLLDWMLPDLDGLSVCRAVRAAGLTVPILMLTARGDLRERVLGLTTGADDYLVKPFEVDELLARIHALLRRATGRAQPRVGELTLDPRHHRAHVAGSAIELTSREYAFLLHLMSRPGQPVPRSELLAQVWDIRYDPGTNVIEVLVSRLRDKLGEHAFMIETVRGLGYCLRGERPS